MLKIGNINTYISININIQNSIGINIDTITKDINRNIHSNIHTNTNTVVNTDVSIHISIHINICSNIRVCTHPQIIGNYADCMKLFSLLHVGFRFVAALLRACCRLV